MFAAAIALAAGLVGAFVGTSFSQGFGPPGFGPFGHGPGFGPHHMGRFGHRFGGGPPDPAFIQDRADRMVRHLAVEVDATPEQLEKLRAIVKAALNDLLPLRERTMTAHQQARTLMLQPTVDRAAIEKLRAERIADADAASKRLVQAIGDAAEVLTPEQRTKLNELFPGPGGFGPPWRRG
jgi:Spy/CpxP family protein refolding chaperone